MSAMHQEYAVVTREDMERWTSAIVAANAQIDIMLKNNLVMKNALSIIADAFPHGHSGRIAAAALKSAVSPCNTNLAAIK